VRGVEQLKNQQNARNHFCCSIKYVKLCNFITHKVVCANQKTESFVYRWLHALAMFDVIYFPSIFGALDIISSILSIRKLFYCRNKLKSPIAFCMCIDFSGVSIISEPSCGDSNLTPSSVISASLSSDTIWNPPLSCRETQARSLI